MSHSFAFYSPSALPILGSYYRIGISIDFKKFYVRFCCSILYPHCPGPILYRGGAGVGWYSTTVGYDTSGIHDTWDTTMYSSGLFAISFFGRPPGRRALRGLALSEGSSGPEPFLVNKTN